VEFIEAPLFTQLLPDFLTDDEYRDLQQTLSRDPGAGDVIPGTGGFRKLSLGRHETAQGKARRASCHLLLSACGFANLADDHLRQGRGKGPQPSRKAASQGGNRKREPGTPEA